MQKKFKILKEEKGVKSWGKSSFPLHPWTRYNCKWTPKGRTQDKVRRVALNTHHKLFSLSWMLCCHKLIPHSTATKPFSFFSLLRERTLQGAHMVTYRALGSTPTWTDLVTLWRVAPHLLQQILRSNLLPISSVLTSCYLSSSCCILGAT